MAAAFTHLLDAPVESSAALAASGARATSLARSLFSRLQSQSPPRASAHGGEECGRRPEPAWNDGPRSAATALADEASSAEQRERARSGDDREGLTGERLSVDRHDEGQPVGARRQVDIQDSAVHLADGLLHPIGHAVKDDERVLRSGHVDRDGLGPRHREEASARDVKVSWAAIGADAHGEARARWRVRGGGSWTGGVCDASILESPRSEGESSESGENVGGEVSNRSMRSLRTPPRERRQRGRALIADRRSRSVSSRSGGRSATPDPIRGRS